MRRILARFVEFLHDSVLFRSYAVRKKLACKYLRGSGLEIGALQHPLEAPEGATVAYVDTVPREEQIRRYPHIEPSRIVATDLLDDGFTLSTIPDASQDFVIANHLLEHSPNPLHALVNWCRVLKDRGILFMTLPDGARNFDQGREITPLEHLLEDYELVRDGNLEQFALRNREHCREFVEISLPNLNRMRRRRPMTQERQQEYLEKLLAEQSTDVHYHVFSRESMEQLCRHLCAHHAPDVFLQEIVPSRLGSEHVVILMKQHQEDVIGDNIPVTGLRSGTG